MNVFKLRFLLLGFGFQALFCSVYKNPSVEHGFTQMLLAERTPGSHGAAVSFSFAQATSSFDEFGQTAPLFACFGPTDFYQLTKLHNTLDKNSKTYVFVRDVCAKGNAETPALSTGPLYSNDEQVLCVAGKVFLSRMQFDAFFDLKNGFAVTAQIPIIVTDCEGLRFVSPSGSKTAFSEIINDRIDEVLYENGIEPINGKHNVCSFGDAKIGLVWSEQFKSDASWTKVKNVSLGIGGFILIPTSMPHGYSKQFLYSIPVGDNGSFGVGMRADASIDLKENVSLLFSGENKVFFQQNFLMRAKLFQKQAGMLINPPVHVWFDNGSTWRLFTGIKFDVPKLNANFFAGYFYDSKEATQLSISDQEFLKNTTFDLVTEKISTDPSKKANQIYNGVVGPLPTTTTPGFQNTADSPTKLQGSVINSERSFQRQYAHWVSFGMNLERRRIGINSNSQDLIIAFNYSYPFFGKNRFILNTFSGCVGASVKLEF